MVYARGPVVDAFAWLQDQGFELECCKELASEKHVDALPSHVGSPHSRLGTVLRCWRNMLVVYRHDCSVEVLSECTPLITLNHRVQAGRADQ